MAGRPRRQAAQVAIAQLLDESIESPASGDDGEGDVHVIHIADIHDGEDSVSSTSDEEAPPRLIRPASIPHDNRFRQARGRGRARGHASAGDFALSNPYVDKDGLEWSSEPPQQRGRRGVQDVITTLGGPTASANKETILETWELFFTDAMLENIVNFSQMKCAELQIPIQLTKPQLKAYIGILYYRGVCGDQKLPLDQLWSEEHSTFYRTAMSRNLFQIWSRVLRFDDGADREKRQETDTFAAISQLWNEWNNKLRTYYKASKCITIDEHLVASRCRSPHRVYNPAKPGKYGELIRWCADAETRYALNGSPLTKRPIDPVAAGQHMENNKAR